MKVMRMMRMMYIDYDGVTKYEEECLDNYKDDDCER